MLTVFKQTFNRFTGGTDEVEFLLLKSAKYKVNLESPFISDFGGTPVLPDKGNSKNLQISLERINPNSFQIYGNFATKFSVF